MRIGFDVDGVLAEFQAAYQDLVVKVTGRDMFLSNDKNNPPCWDWPQYRGYSNGEIQKVWMFILSNSRFWYDLETTRFARNCASRLTTLFDNDNNAHEVYFITDRPGIKAKHQTERWLREWFDLDNATVIVTPDKGVAARLLKLDAYIDDKPANVNAVAAETRPKKNKDYLVMFERLVKDGMSEVQLLEVSRSIHKTPMTRTFLLTRSYNLNEVVDPSVQRVPRIQDFLDAIEV